MLQKIDRAIFQPGSRQRKPIEFVSLALGKSVRRQAILLGIFIVLFVWPLRPRLGITDIDAVSYITGAHSIQAGEGYRGLNGSPLNHWPPGYSLLLAMFPEPLSAALVINYLSLGLATALIYVLARKHGWQWQSALGLSLILGFGFLRGLAIVAKPDILAYALFLLGVVLFDYRSSERRFRWLSYTIWNVLIPFKLIAAVFTPAALLVTWIYNRRREQPILIEIGLTLAQWIAVIGAIVVFNYLTLSSPVAASHGEPSLTSLGQAIGQFITTAPRTLLSHWYGSVRYPPFLMMFALSLILSLAALATLRIHRSPQPRLALLGLVIFVLSWGLQFVRQFYATPRLMGYGLVLILFAFLPKGYWQGQRWLLYGVAITILGATNMIAVNSLGFNDSRYERVANEAGALRLSFSEPLATNAPEILEIHARVPAKPVRDHRELGDEQYFWWVGLPNYDAITTAVHVMEQPDVGWCSIASFEAAIMFRRCDS